MKQTHSGGGVVLNKHNEVLVVNQNGNSWSLPKGHVEEGEDAKQAAAREIEEESGITKLKYIKHLGTYTRHRIGLYGEEDKTEFKTIDIYLYMTDEMELKPIDAQNPEARWVKPEDVEELLSHPKDKAFFASILSEIQEFIAS